MIRCTQRVRSMVPRPMAWRPCRRPSFAGMREVLETYCMCESVTTRAPLETSSQRRRGRSFQRPTLAQVVAQFLQENFRIAENGEGLTQRRKGREAKGGEGLRQQRVACHAATSAACTSACGVHKQLLRNDRRPNKPGDTSQSSAAANVGPPADRSWS